MSEGGRAGWDAGLDFDSTRASLTVAFEAEKARFSDPHYEGREVLYLGAALTQLVNGARASEAWEAYMGWLEDGKAEREVRTRKRGSCLFCPTCDRQWSLKSQDRAEEGLAHARETGHTLEERLVYVPRLLMVPEELIADRAPLAGLVDAHTTLGAYKMFCRLKLKFNSHALRYAWINKVGEMKVPAQVGRLVTQHAHEEQFAQYQRQAEADKLLRKMAKRPKA